VHKTSSAGGWGVHKNVAPMACLTIFMGCVGNFVNNYFL
jgi:hypothetical protein